MPLPLITPRLIHPVPVEVSQVDKPNIVWDDHYREAKTAAYPADGTGGSRAHDAQLYHPPVQLQAQVGVYKFKREVEHSKDGDAPRGDGYLLFDAARLQAAGITLQMGDKITKIANEVVENYIVDLIPMGHYDKPYFIKAVFILRKEGVAGVRSGGLK